MTWKEVRLGSVASAVVSNVNKHSVQTEVPVRLCNYTDVYYNETVTDDLNFMRSTATPEQIERFGLKHGDTVITKDSETADDIGVPAYISNPGRDLVSGYHLAVIRPKGNVNPRFLFWSLKSNAVSAQWEVLAQGVTRVGLRSPDLKTVGIRLPRLELQREIADFLDREAAQVDALIEKQEALMERLQERRRAVAKCAVTLGLHDGNHSGASHPILGQVPEGWVVGPLKRFLRSLDGRRVPLSAEERADRQGNYPYYGASGVIDTVDGYLFDEDLVLVSEDGANLLSRSTPIAFVARGRYWVNNHAHVLRPAVGPVDFWSARIESLIWRHS